MITAPNLDVTVAAGDGWVGVIPAGGSFRIVDLHGNQAADTLFYDAADLHNRYSAMDTIREQGAVYLTTGSRLLSADLDVLATITEDTCGRHDTVGGACSQESNVIRYGAHTRHQHACRQTFLRYGAEAGIGPAELGHNINFFMNVPLTADGGLTFADGVSAPGKYVQVRAERDIIALISNCPQLNNPCNGWNPTPIQLLGWWSQ
ncbi:Urea carboxylase-related aminomethyltransferase [Alloactinosynnema sp. L-07]|uniref:urea amidolyase associated protein UAAP2 n=1 Tax=Alloactinosynnema sp. L-07 TaxID=1653480 RepID=UPI00065F0A02|nr:urea amidolyase associated protein UAAP2 [Alloactinosynnema sp. L-07]CRK57358.1 Urea carboxylase-related aminomethyltransferase [Alloactinosynnema sp. L-07]